MPGQFSGSFIKTVDFIDLLSFDIYRKGQ